MGSLSAVKGLSCPLVCGISVPPPAIKPVSYIHGEFLITESPGKSHTCLDFIKKCMWVYIYIHIHWLYFLCELSVLSLCLRYVSYGRCYKSPQTWWLKTTKIYFLIVLEARSPESMYSPRPTLHSSRGSRGSSVSGLFQSLVAPGVSVGLWLHHSNLRLHGLLLFPPLLYDCILGMGQFTRSSFSQEC